jgi:Ca2+-binding RTX toxin-like protein
VLCGTAETDGSTTINSNGADTIVAGSGATTVNVLGTAGDLVYGGSRVSTEVGLDASVTINGGVGGGTFFGGTAGNNVINSCSGAAIMIGGGSGDVLTATGTANDILEASSGAETLNAAASSGNDAFFGGFGSDSIVGGTGTNAFTAGPGNMTLFGGGASDLYVFLDGATSQTVIQGFNASHDYIKLSGFAAGADQAAFSGATASASGTLITLSDGTHITLAGIAPGTLTSGNFL